MRKRARSVSPLRQPKRRRFASSERPVTEEDSETRRLLPDKKVGGALHLSATYWIQKRLRLEDHVRELDVRAVTSRKFRLTRYCTEFVLHDLDKCSDPEELVRKSFAKCVASALENARSGGIEPTHFGVVIRSINLNPHIEVMSNYIQNT